MITLKENSRTLLVPDDEKYFGVESDEKVEYRLFEIPRLTANGMDLSAFALRINYFNASNVPGQYLVKDAEVNGDMISFSWEFSRKVTAAAGKVLFIICAVSLDESGEIVNEWNTEPAEGTVGKGLEVSDPSDDEDDIPEAVESALLLINQRAQEVIDSIPEDYAALVKTVDELKGDLEQIKQSGTGGADGKSAYQIALDNGFIGTETEWLVSLEGEDGHTPVKGVDYFTESDKSEMINAVIDALPSAEEANF